MNEIAYSFRKPNSSFAFEIKGRLDVEIFKASHPVSPTISRRGFRAVWYRFPVPAQETI